MNNEQWACSEAYRTFRGYVFWQNKPVTITDKGTLYALRREKSFYRYDGSADKQEQPTAASGRPCSKCGKVFSRGIHIHEKYCKGV